MKVSSVSAGDARDAPPVPGQEKTSPAAPPTIAPTHTHANATASAELMHFTAPSRSCLPPLPHQQSQKASGSSSFQGLRTRGAVSTWWWQRQML